MPKPIATWSTARDVWETGDPGLFCEHSDVFSEIFPTSGTTASGEAYGLPTWEHRMVASGSSSSRPDATSLLPTPEAKLSDSGPDYARANREGSGGDDLTTTIHRALLPTPEAGLGSHNRANGVDPAKRRAAGKQVSLADVARHELPLLPTPTTQDGANTAGPSQFDRNSLPLNAMVTLFPTPRASDGEKGGPNQRGSSGDLMLPSAVVQLLPTPTSQNSHGNHTNGRGEDLLPGAAAKILPTPTSSDAKGSRRSTARTDDWTSNPGETLTDAARSIGETTDPPSSDGSGSSDELPPRRPSPDGTDSLD